MFCGSTSLNQNLSSWNVRNVTVMRQMFEEADSFTFNQEVDFWENSGILTYSMTHKEWSKNNRSSVHVKK